jgi:hypothetical protein
MTDMLHQALEPMASRSRGGRCRCAARCCSCTVCVLLRIGARRMLSRISAFDILIMVTIGSTLSRSLTGNVPLIPAMAAAATLVFMHWIAAGIVLSVLSLLGVAAPQLTAVAVIAFGAPLVLSSVSVKHLYLLRRATMAKGKSHSGGELLAGEMASGSAGVQMLAGVTVIILGTLSIAGTNSQILLLCALIVLGATVILTAAR